MSVDPVFIEICKKAARRIHKSWEYRQQFNAALTAARDEGWKNQLSLNPNITSNAWLFERVLPFLQAFQVSFDRDETPEKVVNYHLWSMKGNEERGQNLTATAPYVAWLQSVAPNMVTTFIEGVSLSPNELAKLKAASPELRLDLPPLSSQNLHFSNRLIKDVIGRMGEQIVLKRFVDDDPGFRWLQLAGAGGQGKSRLAFELMLKLRPKWETGFLTPKNLEAFSNEWARWCPSKPHLIVIDYVIGFETIIGHALKELCQHQNNFDVPVRVLLIERQRWDYADIKRSDELVIGRIFTPERQSDWFRKMNLPVGSDLRHEKFRFENGVIELESLSPSDLIKIVKSLLADTTYSDDFISDLLMRIDPSGRPLYAYFLAQALKDGNVVPDWNRSNLLDYVLNREQEKRWKIFNDIDIPNITDDSLPLRLALLATMVGELDCSRLQWLNGKVPDSACRKVAFVLTDTPIDGSATGPGWVVRGLQPDILGEWFVLNAFKNANLRTEISTAAWSSNAVKMSAFLLRLVDDFSDSAIVQSILEQGLPQNVEGVASSITKLADNFLRGEIDPKNLEHSFTLYKLAAKEKFGPALGRLGLSYILGNGVEKNSEIGFKYLMEGVERGDAYAMCYAGSALLYGEGSKKNICEAKKLFLSAGNAGNYHGYASIGIMYHFGMVPGGKKSEAAQWFIKAANLGSPVGKLYAGDCYLEGNGVVRDWRIALEFYLESAALGDFDAMYKAGVLQSGDDEKRDIHSAFTLFRKAASAGHVESLLALADCHAGGKGTEVSLKKAADCYHLAAQAKNPMAMGLYGLCFLFERGVEQDYYQGLEWLTRGAEAGDEEAMTWLAHCRRAGIGCEQDETLAKFWYARSADAGSALGMAFHGAYLLRGGNTDDVGTGISWFQKAAERHLPEAWVCLGFCFLQGIGVRKNRPKAVTLFERAATMENGAGSLFLSACYQVGEGVKKDLQKGMALQERAAQQGIDGPIMLISKL